MASSPSRLTRFIHFALGAGLGGVVGYGILTSGPEPPSLLTAGAAAWILGLAVVCGTLAALSPRAFWRPGGRFRWRHGPDD